MNSENENSATVDKAEANSGTRKIQISDVAKAAIESSPNLSALNNQLNAFKDLASSPAMKASMGATMSLMKDLESQTGQLKNMFSMQNQFTDAMRPVLSDQLKELAKVASQFPKVEVPTITSFPTSARQVSDISETLHQLHRAEAEEKAMRRRGVEAQIQSAKLMADMREQTELMNEALNTLLKHNLEQSKQQGIALQERDKVEAKRFQENARLSKVAAWAGVISAILAAAAICIQIVFR